ncbi:MAG: sigma-E processing peptidase SpoIIGA [Clostridia bacterium]|nr:sigma-E processing peptidase SpoIIGA [Clostridia bacterium]
MRISSWLYLIEQTCIAACLLLSIGEAAGLTRRSPARLTLTSILLALCCLSAQLLPDWLRPALVLPAAYIAPILAWPGVPRRLRWRMAALGTLLSLLLSGVTRLLAPLIPNGLVLTSLASLVLTAMPHCLRRTGEIPRCATVDIRLGSSRLTLTALIDSGNLLRDVVTGLPVIVISRRAASKLAALPEDGTLLPGMRLMSVRTISGTTLMAILRPGSLRILIDGVWRTCEALIGLSPDGYDGFQALVPASLIREETPLLNMISQEGHA